MKPDPSRAFYVIPDGQWETPIVAAFKAFEKGEARGDQQETVLNFIIERLAGTYDLSFRPDARETDFAEGRRFVGLQIRRVLMQKFETLTGKQTSGERPL